MIAQTLVEYGFIQSISEGFMNLANRVGYLIGTGNTKYFILAALALIALFLWSRRRTN
jgi:MYXO-CTERM domain-containing protein